MTDTLLSLSGGFAKIDEADWLADIEAALKGGGIEQLTQDTRDGIKIRPLYRETDHASADNLGGDPGTTPYLRGAHAAPDPYLPWDIRQAFTHPDPTTTNTEILRDLERGVSSVEIAIACSGAHGCRLIDKASFYTALSGVQANLATVALDHQGTEYGINATALLANWAGSQADPSTQKLAFNIDPLSTLMRTGKLNGEFDAIFDKIAVLIQTLAPRFPLATALRIDARGVHEAGGTEAQELGALMAHAVDTLRRLNKAGLPAHKGAAQILFTLSVESNYGISIAKLRAARRLWARIQEALGLAPSPMRLQAVTSNRMLTRYDPWVNILRGTAACFSGAVGGADIITVQAFNAVLVPPEELGRRVARNTHIIAMEESGLGRVADPSGGAWFTETLSNDLAIAAWTEFQTIEQEGGFSASLMSGSFQNRVAKAQTELIKDIAHGKQPIIGASTFALLDGTKAPVSEATSNSTTSSISDAELKALIPGFKPLPEANTVAETLEPIQLAEPFESLRDRAKAYFAKTGTWPEIFAATIGSLAEYTDRIDFARNLFAAAGIKLKQASIPPQNTTELIAAYQTSGCKIAILCGTDKRYSADAENTARKLKAAGAAHVWLVGNCKIEGIDHHIFTGCNGVHALTVAQAKLGIG